MMSRQPLFRAQALRHYVRGREKTVLPRLVAPPVFLCLWLLLGLLLLTTALAWHIQMPRYTRALGALLQSHRPISMRRALCRRSSLCLPRPRRNCTWEHHSPGKSCSPASRLLARSPGYNQKLLPQRRPERSMPSLAISHW